MLLDAEGHIRLTDFGLSRITTREQQVINMEQINVTFTVIEGQFQKYIKKKR